jgi:hypothetical protein
MNTRCVGGATVERPVPQFPAARKNDAVIDNAKSDGHDYPVAADFAWKDAVRLEVSRKPYFTALCPSIRALR